MLVCFPAPAVARGQAGTCRGVSPLGFLQVTQVLVGHVLLPALVHLLGREPLHAIQHSCSPDKEAGVKRRRRITRRRGAGAGTLPTPTATHTLQASTCISHVRGRACGPEVRDQALMPAAHTPYQENEAGGGALTGSLSHRFQGTEPCFLL